MTVASCHCGAVAIAVADPTEVTDCNCSICRRYGVLWAYCRPDQATFVATGPTDRYLWDDRSIAFHRCAHCGCVTHWSAVAPERQRMGVNARLMPPEVLGRARVRRLDGAVTERYLDE